MKNPFKITALPAGLLFLAIAVSGIVYVRYTWVRIENEKMDQVMRIARSIEAILPKDAVKALEAKPEDIGKPQYQIIKNSLVSVIQINTKARFAYIYIEKNGKIYFMADSEPADSKDYSPPGQEYTEAKSADKQPFRDGKELITDPLPDRWGNWISVLIPIKDEATGKTYAVFGMDFNSTTWDGALMFEVMQSGSLIVLLMLTLFFLFKINAKNKSLNIEVIERRQVEKELLDSENQKAAILKAIPDLLFVFNQHGEYLDVYTEDDSKLLISREALIGKNIADLFPADIAGNAIAAFKQSISRKELVQYPYSIKVNGKTEFFEARIVPTSEDKVLAIVRDTTAHKESEEALARSQERARKQRNAIARIAVDEVIAFGDPVVSFQRLTEEVASAMEAERVSIWLFSEGKRSLQCISLFENNLKKHSSGAILNAANYPRYFEAIHQESRISASDARQDPRTSEFTEGYLVPLGIFSMLDAGIHTEGELLGVICIEHTEDIRTWFTDEESFASTVASIVAQTLANNKRKHSEEALRISEDKYRTMIEFSNDLIWMLDLDGNFTFFNEITSKTTGLSLAEWKGKSFIPLIIPEDLPMIMSVFQKSLSGEACNYELRFKKSADTILTISVNTSPIFVSGKIEGIVSFGQDITERKKAEEAVSEALMKAEAGDRLKAAFINNISHEVRTPLNGILGFGGLIIQSDITDDDKSDYYLQIKTSSDRLLGTINNYMDISLIASGNITPDKKVTDLHMMLDQLRDQYGPLCAAKNIALSLDVPGKEDGPRLFTDDGLLRKALSHLLDNALKFTIQGEIRFGYNIKTVATDAAHAIPATAGTGPVEIAFFVNDTGIGIGMKSLSVIFESFKQEEFSLIRSYEGSGLGLSIAQGFVKLLGGTIGVASEKGTGSSFFFTLPYDVIIPGDAPGMLADRPAVAEKPVILIAEDDVSNFLYLEAIFKKEYVTLLSALNGKEAVDQCMEHPEISLVLMDLRMPGMDGLEATRQIKSFRKDIKIIAITAFGMSGDEKRALDAGCDDYLSKPVRRETLMGKLKKYQITN